jgi:ribonuclease PH
VDVALVESLTSGSGRALLDSLGDYADQEALALSTRLRAQGRLAHDPNLAPVAAVSVGLVGDPPVALLDLAYVEDSTAVVDLNVVALRERGLVEVQGTGEHGCFSRAQLDALLDLAEAGLAQLYAVQARALEGAA